MVTFHDKNLPDDRREWVMGMLVSMTGLLPWWVAEVWVRYQHPTEIEHDAHGKPIIDAAEVTPRPQYRDFTLMLYPGLFGMSDAEARATLTHELAHLPLYPAWELAQEQVCDLCDLLVKQGMDEDTAATIRDTFQKALGRANEAATEDVARIYAQLLGEPL
jgi:hypothetical protein